MDKIMKKIIWVLVLVLVLNVIIRLPLSPHEIGIDSFRTHYLSNSIQKEGFAKWILNPLSVMGLYPYSYSSGIPFLLVILSDVTHISLEFIILLFSIFLSIIGSLGIYLFVEEYNNNKNIAILSMFIFSISPLFFSFTQWTISTRAPFVVLIPFLLWSLLKFEKTKKSKFIAFFVFLTVIESFIHKMFLLIFLVLIPSYIISKLIYNNLKKHPNSIFTNKIYIFLIIVGIFLFLMQFSNIEPYKSYKWTYHTGIFFDAGTLNDYRLGNLNNTKLFLNMIIDYASNIGIASIFMVISIYYLLKKIKSGDYRFDELFIIIFLLVATPFLINGYYTCFFYLPIFSLLSATGLTFFINKLNIKKSAAIVFPIFIISSLIFSIFMQLHWMNNFQKGFYNPWVEDTTLSSVGFLEQINKEGGSTIVSNNLLNQRIRAFTNLPLLPADKREDVGVFIYNLIRPKDLPIDFSLGYLATSTKSIVRIKEQPIDSEKDWEQIIARDIYSTQEIRNFYNVDYVLEKKDATYIRTHWEFYKDLKQTQPKIYDNNNEEIWSLQNV